MIFPRERSGALASLLFEGNDGTMEFDRNFLMGSIIKTSFHLLESYDRRRTPCDDMADGYAPMGRGNCRGEMFGAGPRTKEENYFGETAENQNSFEGL